MLLLPATAKQKLPPKAQDHLRGLVRLRSVVRARHHVVYDMDESGRNLLSPCKLQNAANQPADDDWVVSRDNVVPHGDDLIPEDANEQSNAEHPPSDEDDETIERIYRVCFGTKLGQEESQRQKRAGKFHKAGNYRLYEGKVLVQ